MDGILNWAEVIESARLDGQEKYEKVTAKREGDSRSEFLRERASVRSDPNVQLARSLNRPAEHPIAAVREIPRALATFHQISDGSNGMSSVLPIAIAAAGELLNEIRAEGAPDEATPFHMHLCRFGIYGNRIPLYVWRNVPDCEVVIASLTDSGFRIISRDIDALFKRVAFCIQTSIPFDFFEINPKLIEYIKSSEGPEYLPGGEVGRKRYPFDRPDLFPSHWISEDARY